VPSLHTFLKDTKWLEPSAKIIRRILPVGLRLTIRNELYDHFKLLAYRLRGTGSSEDVVFGHAYRTLWMFTIRDFVEYSDVKLRLNERGLSKLVPRSNTEPLYKLVQEALELGFRTLIVLSA
jgi:Protein of unknown function (DUF3723)